MVLALEMLRMHRHHRDAVALGQRIRRRVHVVADDLHHAGGHKKHRLRAIFRHDLAKGGLDLFQAAEGYVVSVQHHRYAAPAQPAEIVGVQGHVLGIIGALIRADDDDQAVPNAAHRHGSAHQRAVRAGKHGVGQRRDLFHALYLTERLHPPDQFFSVHHVKRSFPYVPVCRRVQEISRYAISGFSRSGMVMMSQSTS